MLELPQLVDGEKQERRSTAIAALVRVARHYGLVLDAEQLIRNNPFDTKEPTTALLLKMAERVGLRGKLMRIKRGELFRLTRLVPAILLLPNGKAALISRVHQVDGASFALVDELESERGLTALYDEPRLFEFWHGDVIL